MARNLGLVMRSLFGMGTARSLQAEGDLADTSHSARFDMQSELKPLSTTIHRAGQKMPAGSALALAA